MKLVGYTGRRQVGCYIWYSDEGTGRGRSPPRPLLAVPNVTVYLSTASVPITISLLINGPWLCRFNVVIKGLRVKHGEWWIQNFRFHPLPSPLLKIPSYSGRSSARYLMDAFDTVSNTILPTSWQIFAAIRQYSIHVYMYINALQRQDFCQSCHFYERASRSRILSLTNASDTHTRNRHQKPDTRKPVPVSGASDMQFCTEFISCRFSVTNTTVLYFWAGLWYRFSGAGFRRRFLICQETEFEKIS